MISSGSGWKLFTRITSQCWSFPRLRSWSHINDLPGDVICNIAIYADDTTLYSKCDQASDMWQQLKLASELQSDLRDTVDWGKKWLVDFNAEKTHLLSFDQSNYTGSISFSRGCSVSL